MVVRATDGGDAGNVSITDFTKTITVTDINDCAPVFDRPGVCGPTGAGAANTTVYTCLIAEASGSVCVETTTASGGGQTTVSSPLVVGRVTDADATGTDNSALSFALVGNGGYLDGLFAVNAGTGLVSVAATLDSSFYPNVNLGMVVSDRGTPSLSALAELRVRGPCR